MREITLKNLKTKQNKLVKSKDSVQLMEEKKSFKHVGMTAAKKED